MTEDLLFHSLTLTTTNVSVLPVLVTLEVTKVLIVVEREITNCI